MVKRPGLPLFFLRSAPTQPYLVRRGQQGQAHVVQHRKSVCPQVPAAVCVVLGQRPRRPGGLEVGWRDTRPAHRARQRQRVCGRTIHARHVGFRPRDAGSRGAHAGPGLRAEFAGEDQKKVCVDEREKKRKCACFLRPRSRSESATRVHTPPPPIPTRSIPLTRTLPAYV
jgi:hypothetical protein